MKNGKVKVLLGTVLLALAVAACGGKQEADSETAQAEEAADQEEGQQKETETLEAQETEEEQDTEKDETEDSETSDMTAETSGNSGSAEGTSENTAQEEKGQTGATAGNGGQEQAADSSESTAEASGSTQTADTSQETAAQSPESGAENSEETGVPAKVKIYEATYFAEAVYRNVNLETEWPPYCEIDISNVTDTSFDFTVYQITNNERELIFKTHTAVFNGDGTTAVYNGQEYTLNFTFPNSRNSLPDVTEIQVTGFAPLEGETYLYNQVPGHEFG